MRVLIAYDGSKYGEEALADLHRAGMHDVEALVLTVGEVWLPPDEVLHEAPEAVRDAIEAHRAAAIRHARRVAGQAEAWLREHFPHWHLTAEGDAGSPVESIARHVADWPADLVVIGAHGHTLAPRLFPGSVSLGVLRHVSRFVRVARKPPEHTDPETRLLVAVDGSKGGSALLQHIRSRVWPAPTQVQVLSVVDTRLMPLVIPDMEIGPTSEQWARHAAERFTGALRDCGLAAFPSVERGDPKHVILTAAENWRADCIFVGARGLSHPTWLHLGHVATTLAMRAHCSVEVVRQASNVAAEGTQP